MSDSKPENSTSRTWEDIFYDRNGTKDRQDTVRGRHFGQGIWGVSGDSDSSTDMEWSAGEGEPMLKSPTISTEIEDHATDLRVPRAIGKFLGPRTSQSILFVCAWTCWSLYLFISARQDMALPKYPRDDYTFLVERAQSLMAHYALLGTEADMEQAIICFRQALLVRRREGDPRSLTMHRLAAQLVSRHSLKGDVRDLDEAIFHYHKLLRRPLVGLKEVDARTNLANFLTTRYKIKRDVTDLMESYYQGAHTLLTQNIPRSDPAAQLGDLIRHCAPPFRRLPWYSSLLGHLENVTSFVWQEHRRRGDLESLDMAINHLRIRLALGPLKSHYRPITVHNLADALRVRYEVQSDPRDIDEALSHYQTIIKDAMENQSRQYIVVGFADCYRNRFRVTNDIDDLEYALNLYRNARYRQTIGRPLHSMILNSLASCLVNRYEQLGNAQDLDEALGHHRVALDIHRLDNHDHATCLIGLSNVLRLRYEQGNHQEDLQEAIDLNREASGLLPHGHPIRSAALSSHGLCLHHQYKQLNRIEDLDLAINHHREAMSSLPNGYLGPISLSSRNNLAICLKSRFRLTGDIPDLNEAIELHRYCLIHTVALQNSDLLPIWSNLGLSFRSRYNAADNLDDIHEAVQCFETVLKLASPNDARLTQWMHNLASTYIIYSKIPGHEEKRDEALRLFEKSALHNTGGIRQRFQFSYKWADNASGMNQTLAYRTCLNLADRYLLMRPSVAARHQLLATVPRSLACDAAACAIVAGQLEMAIELLEQGKTILWSQMGRYRTSLDALRDAKPSLAAEFEKLSQQLDTSSTSPTLANGARLSVERVTRKHGGIAENWDRTLEKIRKLDGFGAFLKPKSFGTLQAASANGPIIIPIVSKSRCDIIIMRNGFSPVLLPLPDLRVDDLDRLSSDFSDAISTSSVRMRDRKVIGVLRFLWEEVVKYVVDRLQSLVVAPGSRIWWCPTSVFAMLPLHAAGPYRGSRPNLPDIYVSSYTPTLSDLIESSRPDSLPSPPTLLIVAQPQSPGQSEIPGVWKEISRIKQVIPNADILSGDSGTSEAVLSGLRTHRWVHMASHGSQNLSEPFNSCFYLHDKPLYLLDIIQARLPNAEFAFLSACHSAAGDKRTPDETIHLAAGLQFSGFRSVIGTMYPMADDDGPMVAEEVYRYMYRHLESGNKDGSISVADHRDSAKALNIATRALKEAGVPVSRWINYVHIGA